MEFNKMNSIKKEEMKALCSVLSVAMLPVQLDVFGHSF
jgi:hypothetical protein